MPNVMYYKFEINGIDVSSYILNGTQIQYNRKGDSGNTAKVNLAKTVNSIITLQAGQVINIWRGEVTSTDTKIFKGVVKSIKPLEAVYELVCFDELQKLVNKYLTISYDKNIDPEAGEVSAIAQDIIERGGFTASVVATGTTTSDITLDKFNSDNDRYIDRLRTLAQIVNYTMYYDYDNDWVRFQPVGFTTYSTSLIVGQNVFNFLEWEQNIEPMRNDITVDGAVVYDTRTVSFTGDGVTSTYNFDYTPDTTECTVAGVLKTRGAFGATTGYDYTVDVQNKTFTFTTPPAGSAAIVMKYTTFIPTPVRLKNYSSISLYGLTQEDTYKFSDISTVADAESRALSILQLLKDGTVKTKIYTNERDIFPGQVVDVQDSNNPYYSGQYIVYSVTINYPDFFDVIEVGTQDFDYYDLITNINERLKAIEKNNNKLASILRQIIGLSSTMRIANRSFTAYTRDVSTDTIWGSFYWGQADWDGTYDNALVEVYHHPGNNTFEEYVQDNDYYDAANSSGVTWNTTTKEITINAAGYLTTKRIALGTIFSFITVNAETYTGTIDTVEISADGKTTWQIVPLYTRVPIATATADGVYIRITASTSVVLKNTYTIENQYTDPAIQVILEQ